MVINNSKKTEFTPHFSEKSAGFTLVEILVAMVIFSIIIGAALEVFVTGIKSQRRIFAQQELLDQTSYALEYMSRAIRMTKKDLTATCLSQPNLNYELTHSGEGIKFKNYNGECQEFYLENNQLRENKNGSVFALTSTSTIPRINSFEFVVSGQEQDDNLQPAVTVFWKMEGRDQVGSQIQTTISQRNFDVSY
ncbi:MAG: prepilin-type N-terminal cleavage/methylation domain-containing protein [Patescibacteria group bacterium]